MFRSYNVCVDLLPRLDPMDFRPVDLSVTVR